nr:MAG TPA: hypothetical protein [Caudoviricetes sp.]
MAIDFGQLLTTEQKRAILEARIASFANEGYQHTLNKAAATSEEQIANADEAIEIISAAIEAHQAELDSLPAEG